MNQATNSAVLLSFVSKQEHIYIYIYRQTVRGIAVEGRYLAASWLHPQALYVLPGKLEERLAGGAWG